MIKAVRGTRDLLPPDTDLWNWVDAKVRDVLARYNFHEIRTPIFEDTQLFSRSVGEETDIVTKEMFTWQDRHPAIAPLPVLEIGSEVRDRFTGQSLTLRPENTAGVVRAYIEHGLDKKGTLQKLYYIGPQFRRERPQKGRYRQFYQIGAEIIGPPSAGSESPLRDAEVLEMLATLLDEVGLRDWQLQLNSVGCAEDRARYNQALREALKPVVHLMDADCQRRAETNPLRVLDCKVPEDQPIIEKLPKISQYLDEPCRRTFRGGARDAGCRRHSLHNQRAHGARPRLLHAHDVRIHAWRTGRAKRSAGRRPLRWTFGVARRSEGARNRFRHRRGPADSRVAIAGRKAGGEGAGIRRSTGRGNELHALTLARELRREGISADIGDETFRLKKSFETAEKAGARFVVIIGENEVAAEQFAVKDLASGEQVQVARADLAAYLRRR